MSSLIKDIKRYLGVAPYEGNPHQGCGELLRDLLKIYGDKKVSKEISKFIAPAAPPAPVLNLYHIRVLTFGDGGRVNTERYVRARREPTVNEILDRLNVNLAQICVNAVDYPIWDLPEEATNEPL